MPIINGACYVITVIQNYHNYYIRSIVLCIPMHCNVHGHLVRKSEVYIYSTCGVHAACMVHAVSCEASLYMYAS